MEDFKIKEETPRPSKYLREEVSERITDAELTELNKLLEEFQDFFDKPADSRYKRWLELDTKAFPLDEMTA